MNSTCILFQISKLDELWNSPEPRIPECIQETLFNGLPGIVMILWLARFYLLNDQGPKSTDRVGLPESNSSFRSVVIFLCAAINMVHAAGRLTHWNSSEDYIHLVSLVIYLVKSFLLVWTSLLIQKNGAQRLPGLLWIPSLFELLFALSGTLHTYIYFSEYQINELVIFSIHLSVSFVLFVTFCHDQDKSEKICNRSGLKSRDQSSCVSGLLLWWFTLLVKYGYKKPLDFADLPMLTRDMDSEKMGQKFHQKVSRMKCKTIKLTPLMLQIFWKDFTMMMLLQTLCDCVSLMLPILIKFFIIFMNSDIEVPTWHGYCLGISMFLCSSLLSLLKAQVGKVCCSAKTKIRLCINASIYKKILRMRRIDLSDLNTGKIFNLISIDSFTLVVRMERLGILWSAPLRLILGGYLMYQTVGYVTFISLGSWASLIFVMSLFTRLTKKYMLAKLEVTDRRVKLINEILDGIKSIKFYAWEECLMEKIAFLRQEEVVILKKMETLDTLLLLRALFGGWICMVTLFSGRLLLQGKSFTSEEMFFILSIIETMTIPITQLQRVLQDYMMTSASARRIEDFMNLKEVETYVKRVKMPNAIKIDFGTFSWNSGEPNSNGSEADGAHNQAPKAKKFSLKEMNLSVEVGTFTCVIGSVGSGKSSLLNAVLGGMVKNKGEVEIQEGLTIAVVPQEAWIQNMTLKQNILFGGAYDEDRYRQVLAACELIEDIKMLPGGDETEIGENGINLSGGQKQRVSLARAVYQDADIYLLDDCLSALDSQVSKKIFNQVLHGKLGLLKGKTLLMATNRLNILNEVDQIIFLENGSITEMDSPGELARTGGKVSELIKSYTDYSKHHDTDVSREESTIGPPSFENMKLIEKEFIVEDQVDGKVYLTLAKKSSKLWLAACLTSIPLFLWSSIYSRNILAKWTEFSEGSSTGLSDHSYLIKYTVLSACEGIFLCIMLMGIAFAYLKTCQGLHYDMLKAVLYSSIRFFDTTPIGRILNRFSNDFNSIDMVLRESLRFVFNTGSFTIPGIIATFVVQPELGIMMSAFIVLSLCLLRYHMVANRRLKRLESVAKSPIFSHSRETIIGLDLIRICGASQRFNKEFEDISNLHANSEYLMSLILVWRAMIIGFLSSFIFAFIAFYGVIRKGKISGADVGLLLSYAVRILGWVGYFLKAVSIFGEQIIAVERVLEYTDLPSEGDRFKFPFDPSVEWPPSGGLGMKKYTARYRKGLEPSLRDLTASIRPKEKIGVVGRTGAGKSSLTLSLFRMIERIDGNISIDEEDIENIGLFHLRSGLSIIPQDPVIFSGSVRFNLDPFSKYSDGEVWRALEMSHLKDYFEKFGAGLDYVLVERGKNLSGGQKQLICLARSLLKNSKIIVLDEATGSIDMETDSLVQKTLREEFANSTMLIIAHRLDTIIDCDRIMVLDCGRIIEFDTPQNLLQDEFSKFFALAKDAKVSIKSLEELVDSTRTSLNNQ